MSISPRPSKVETKLSLRIKKTFSFFTFQTFKHTHFQSEGRKKELVCVFERLSRNQFRFLLIRQVGRSFSNLSEKVIALGLARVLSVFLVLSLFISDISSFSASREDLRDYRRISSFCFIIPHLRPKENKNADDFDL